MYGFFLVILSDEIIEMSEQWSEFEKWKQHCNLSTFIINTFFRIKYICHAYEK